jgi:integral membrane protein
VIEVYLHSEKEAMSLESQVKIFRWISIFEGISFLVLLLIAMPLKYIWDAPEMVRIVGMAHGWLFVAYIAGAFYLFKPLKWKTKTLAIVCLSSVLPLGPFYVEKKYL